MHFNSCFTAPHDVRAHHGVLLCLGGFKRTNSSTTSALRCTLSVEGRRLVRRSLLSPPGRHDRAPLQEPRRHEPGRHDARGPISVERGGASWRARALATLA